MFFFKKNDQKTWDAYENRLQDVEKRLKKAENEILGLATENMIIRNKVLRKIQEPQKDHNTPTNPDSQETEPKCLNSPFSIHV